MMTKKLLCLLAAALTMGAAGAQETGLWEDAEASLKIYKAMNEVLKPTADGSVPAFCLFKDLNNDGMPEIVIGDTRLKKIQAYDVTAGNRPLTSIPDTDELAKELGNHPLKWLAMNLSLKNDITVGDAPLFVKPEKAKNRFTTVTRVDNSSQYTNIVFKPHVGKAKFVTKTYVEKIFDGTDIGYDALVYSLEDPSFIAKMLRGYNDNEARPVVVTDKFLTTHNPLQYSRWKQGEPITRANADVRRIIENYFKGERIRQIQWLADIEVAERHFYQVLFEPRGGYCVNALVCIAEGEVASTMTESTPVEAYGPSWVDKNWGSDIDDTWYRLPGIMCAMGTQEGLELYAVWNSMEGIHYSVLREVGEALIVIYDDSEYTGAY